jgi:hemin uptake protein HemP
MTAPGVEVQAAAPKVQQPQPQSDALRVVTSRDLLQGQVCVSIEHAGAIYTLRATRSGKLILTK